MGDHAVAVDPYARARGHQAPANRHARDMAARRYFGHVSPGGADLAARVRRTGYLRTHGAWWLGETLAWGPAREEVRAGVRSLADITPTIVRILTRT